MHRVIFRALLLACCGLMFVATATAQDFQKTYRIPAGGSINIRNVSGNISITGYDGDAISVAAYKGGNDRDKVEVQDLSTENRIDLEARYPEQCDCNAHIRFELRVPRAVNYSFDQITTASGNIAVNSIRGEVRVATASGDVEVKNVTGEVSARSASGDVDVEISSLEGTGDMKFASASGDVHVRLPAGLDADVKLSTISGTVKTDFPIEVKQPRYGPGSNARGRLGSGSRTLQISSASGDVSLMKL
jgi:Putative adhesin